MLEKTAAELGAGPRISTYTVPITVTGLVVRTVDETDQDSAVRAALAICGLGEGETYLLSGQRFRVESVTAGRAAWKAAVRFTLPY
jgi:hypothetical protein